MKTIDYVYRFDPKNPSVKLPPPDAEAAKRTLEGGNLMFSNWMESCRTSTFSQNEPRYVVQCNGLEVGMVRTEGQLPKQLPFAVVVGCSDARVPTEMVFGQGFNDLFVIRVAGNVLGDECLGSIDFALNALAESIKCVVMLGHSGCGAVTGAVDAYLQPLKFWSRSTPPMLRSILQRLFVPVRESANALKEAWGNDARKQPGYRAALIDLAVHLNAAHAAYALRSEVERSGRWEIEVLYGVYNLFTHKVDMPIDLHPMRSEQPGGLAYALSNPRDFAALALRLANKLCPSGEREGMHPMTGNPTSVGPMPVSLPKTNGATHKPRKRSGDRSKKASKLDNSRPNNSPPNDIHPS
jgi:carbonic anhydrase